MTKVTLDAATLAKLGGLTGPTALYDEAGRLLARVKPIPPCPFTDEEIEAAFRQTGPGKTLDELIREYNAR